MSVLPNQTSINLHQNLFALPGGGGGNYIPETNVIIPAPATNSYADDPIPPSGQKTIFQTNTNDLQGLYLYNADIYLNGFNWDGETPTGSLSLYFTYTRTVGEVIIVYNTIVNQYYDNNFALIYFPIRAIVPFTLGSGEEPTNVEILLTNQTTETLVGFDYTIQNRTTILISNQFTVL
jgi:hypothetical protein